MTNEQLIKSAYIYALVLFACLFGLVMFGSSAESNSGSAVQQNTNSNTNTNQNANANTNTRNTNNGNASGEQTGTAAMTSRDHKFVMDAAMAGLMEVELGRWASQKGTSAEVKAFGQRMVTDHTAANTELMQLASGKGMTLATQIDAKHQKDVSKITRLSGAEFDRAYSKMMLKDHQKVVSNFEKQSTNGDDADLKAFAAKTLPTLQEHLQMARALPGNAGAGNSNGNTNSNMNSNSNRNSNGNSNRP